MHNNSVCHGCEFRRWVNVSSRRDEKGRWVQTRSNLECSIDDGKARVPQGQGVSIIVRGRTGVCPAGKFKFPDNANPDASKPAPPAPAPEPWSVRGPKLWGIMHRAALADSIEQSDLPGLAARLDCGTCRAHWISWLAANPLPVTGQFAWSVAAHNAVNVRLEKPVMTVDEARAKWTQAEPAA